MGSVTLLELKKNIQDRGLLFWAIILPILFIVLFFSVFTSGQEDVMKDEVILSIIPWYTVMFVFFIIISMCSSILLDQNKVMVAMLLSTPLRSVKYLLLQW